MARIALIEPSKLLPKSRKIYEQKLKGKPGNAQKALAHRPGHAQQLPGLYASVAAARAQALQTIYIRTSLINQCHYCLQHHLASSKRTGVTAR